MTIPSQWSIPEYIKNGIIINFDELRLYFFDEKNAMVMTYPVGIGDRKFPTPKGDLKFQ